VHRSVTRWSADRPRADRARCSSTWCKRERRAGDYAVDGGYRGGDLVGDCGRQDELAREIYRPGSGTDF
jgi:hypothetical protein